MERNKIRIQSSNQRNRNTNPSLGFFFLWASCFSRKAEIQALLTDCGPSSSQDERAPLPHSTFIKSRPLSAFLPCTAQAHCKAGLRAHSA